MTGTSIALEIDISYYLKFDCSIIPTLANQTLSLNQEWQVSLPSSSVPFSPFSINSGFYPFNYGSIGAPSNIPNVPANTGQTSFVYFEYSNAGGRLDLDFEFQDVTPCSTLLYTVLSKTFAVGNLTTPNGNLSYITIGTGPYPNTADIHNGQKLVVRVEFSFTGGCVSKCPQASFEFRWKCKGAPLSFCSPCQYNPYLTTVTWMQEPITYEVLRIEPSGPLADFDNSCNQDNFHWKAIIENTSSFTTINNLTLELSGPNSGVERMVFIDAPAITLQSSPGTNATISTPTTLFNTAANNCFAPDVYNITYTVDNLDPGESVVLDFYTKRCYSADPVLFNVNKKFNQWVFSSNCLDACGNTVIPTLNELGAFNTITTAGGGISTHSNSPNKDINLLTTSVIPNTNQITSQPVPPIGTSLPSFAVTTKCFEVSLSNFVGDNFDYQILGNNNLTTLPLNIFGVLRAEIEIIQDGLIIENHPSHIVLRYNGIDYPGDCYNNFNVPGIPGTLGVNNVGTRTLCKPGIYYTYFNLDQIPNVVDLVNNGSLKYCLLACCTGNNPGSTDYKVKFSLLPNDDQNPCFTYPLSPSPINIIPPYVSQNTWIPLSKLDRYIQVHCPGCAAPGIIVKDYRMERTNFGYEDSNDDNIADNTNVINAAYIANHPDVEFNTATHGDMVRDFLTAHFQDGDNTLTPPGYKYSFMNTSLNISKLTNLQFLINVPFSDVGNMDLEIIGFDFYVDDPSATPCPTCCEDCDLFPATNASIATSFEMHYAGTVGQIPPFLQRVGENYLFTIDEAYLSSPTASSNITFNSYFPFTGFSPEQYYRLSVRYRVNGNIQTQLKSNSVSKVTSGINAAGWLTGNIPAVFSGTSVINLHTQMPNEASLLTLPLSQSFADGHRFFCEFSGTFFNFVSSDYFTSAIYSIGLGGSCEDYIVVTAIVGFDKTEVSFPNEYKSPNIVPHLLDIIIPAGYEYSSTASTPRINTIYWTNPLGNIPTGVTTSSYDISSSLPILTLPCNVDRHIVLNLSNIMNSLPSSFSCKVVGVNPTNELVLGDGKTFINISIPIQPCDCNSSPVFTSSGTTTCVTTFVDKESILPFCQPIAGWIPSFSDVKGNEEDSKTIYHPDPNLLVNIVPQPVQVNSSNVCWSITVANPDLAGQNPPFSNAPNVFLQLPSVPYLSNWSLNLTNLSPPATIIGTVVPSTISGSSVDVMTIEPNLTLGTTLSGLLCAHYNQCQGTSAVNFSWGWNCEGFPSIALPVDVMCEVETINEPLEIDDADAKLTYNFTASGVQPTTYDLCSTVSVKACFISSANGQIQPFSLNLLGANIPGLTLPSTITISNCAGTGSATLALNTGTNSYPISIPDLNSLGFADDYLDLNECICFEIVYETNCDYFGQLPEIEVQALSYCGNIINSKFANNPLAFSGIVNCTNQGPSCVRIEKRVAQNNNPCDWVTAGEPFTYEIEIWNFSGSNSIVLDDNLASACFTPDPPQIFPMTLTIPNNGVSTIIPISGYFHNGCAPVSTNSATVTDVNNNLWASSVDVNVEDNCAGVGVNSFRNVSITNIFSTIGIPPNNTFSNMTFDFAGTIEIDDHVIFDNCIIKMEPGAEIIIKQLKSLLFVNNSIVEACTRMWKGIVLEQESRVVLHDSKLRDAEIAILLTEGATFDVFNGDIENCVENILARTVVGSPVSFITLGPCRISETRIGMTTGFKLPYCNQAPFDNRPKAAIELNDVRNSFVIGNAAAGENHFFNMTSGIILRNCSDAQIVNTKYSDIYRSAYNTKSDPEIGVPVYAKGISVYNHRITILPVTNIAAITMNNTSIGILLDEMDGAITGQRMELLDIGIYIRNMKFSQQLDIRNCNITPKKSGIELENNNGARQIRVFNNTIAVNNKFGLGIEARELISPNNANYFIENNTISLTGTQYGIHMSAADNAFIRNNVIFQTMNGLNDPNTAGIAIEGAFRNTLSCNHVGSSLLSNLSVGYEVTVSPNTYMQCNSSTFSNIGIYFKGPSPFTSVKGNSMYQNTGLGLELDNTALIGQQPHHGNKWTGPFGFFNFGAEMIGASVPRKLANEFTVHTSQGSLYHPDLPGGSIGWFVQLMGSAFICPTLGSQACNIAQQQLIYDNLEQLIATDVLTTPIYNDETRNQNMQYLFERLQQDSVLLYSDSILLSFYLSYSNSNLEHIADARNSIGSINTADSIFNFQLNVLDSSIEYRHYEIYVCDSVLFINPEDVYYQNLRESLLINLETLISNRIFYLSVKEAEFAGYRLEAEVFNNQIIPTELPEQNVRTLFTVYDEFQTEGRNAITTNFQEILSIAHQCPQAGGPYVFIARNYLKYMGWHFDYNDAITCLQQGIFREEGGNEIKNSKSTMLVFPNPAGDLVKIDLIDRMDAIQTIELLDQMGRIVYSVKSQEQSPTLQLNLQALSQGVYVIRCTTTNKFVYNSKLIIQK